MEQKVSGEVGVASREDCGAKVGDCGCQVLGARVQAGRIQKENAREKGQNLCVIKDQEGEVEGRAFEEGQ